MKLAIELGNEIEEYGRELRGRIYRNSIDEILREWDEEGACPEYYRRDFQRFLFLMFQFKWHEYVISN